MFAGFDYSPDMMEVRAADYAGAFLASAAIPTVALYERLKFGDYASLSVSDSIADSDALVMIVHSTDDETVPASVGYDKYYERYKSDPRVTFLLYEDRGHNRLYYSEGRQIDSDLMLKIDEMFQKA